MVFDRLTRARSIAAAVLLALSHFVTAFPASAITLLRDPDIERGLRELATPVLRAAGLNPSRVRILVVGERSLNAFVIDGRAIYLHYGLIERMPNAAALQAVIAHEAAHIANGHIARRLDNLQNAKTIAGLGAALSVLAGAAGASGEAVGGLAAGTSSTAFRAFLSHTRAEESSADRSALRYMAAAGINPKGMLDVHEIFRGQEALTAGRQDPYMRSHPLTRDRIRAAQAYLSGAKTQPRPNASSEYWFARARGKLSAFTRSPAWTLRNAKSESAKDIRLMREAAAYSRQNKLSRALKAIDSAIKLRPNDPYLHDLKGQILIDNRQAGAAVGSYRRAQALAPRDALISAGLGRALLAAKQPKAARAALEQSRDRDTQNPRMLRDLAQAYAQTGQPGMASLVTAERYALLGRLKDAGVHAKRASGLLPRGSGAWRRAQDVLIAYERTEKRKKR